MAITLVTPLPKESVEPRLMGWGRQTDGAFGAAIQSIDKAGSRYAVDASFSQLDEDCARELIAARLRSKTTGETVRWSWPQPTYDGLVGTPLVKGAGQSGSLLAIDAATAGAPFRALDFFSFETESRAWLHAVHTSGVADGSGEASLAISPMLRVIPADNAALNFSAPVIEGLFAGNDVGWKLEQLCVYGVSFTIFENR